MSGHPLHPMVKTRMPLVSCPDLDLFPYFPELQNTLSVHIVLVPWELVEGQGMKSCDKVLHSPLYAILPIHPLQYETYSKELDLCVKRGLLIDLKDSGLEAVAQASMRTVSLLGKDLVSWDLKLSLDIVTTSSRRRISRHAIHNGPIISRACSTIESVIQALLAPFKGTNWHVSWKCAREVASIRLDLKSRDELEIFGAKNIGNRFGAIWRETTRHFLPIFAELPSWEQFIKHSCVTSDPAEALLDKHPFEFKVYYSSLLTICVYSIVIFGVSLEAHMQNTLISWRVENHNVIRCEILFRDFGGIKILPELFHEMMSVFSDSSCLSVSLLPGSGIAAREYEELLGHFVHDVLFAHLLPLVNRLFGADSSLLSDIISTLVTILETSIESRPLFIDLLSAGQQKRIKDNRNRFIEFLGRETIPYKAFMRMKDPQLRTIPSRPDIFVPVPNIFHPFIHIKPESISDERSE